MYTMKMVIVGAGFAGCAAAVCAAKNGADVTLLERTDMLLGTGLVGGIMRNNGRFTATEEMVAMGGGDLFGICDGVARHRNITFPGHNHASIYDVGRIHRAVYDYLEGLGVKIFFRKRVCEVTMNDGAIASVSDGNDVFDGDVFVDATGTAGPVANCVKHGNGCAMCVLRCPSFGGRKSLAGCCGVSEVTAGKADGSPGAMSGSCKLLKESLSADIQRVLNESGVAVIPITKALIDDKTGIKACQQYASKEFSENIIILDTGHAKLMSPYYDLQMLRLIPGFEGARYEDPYAGGLGNSMRFFDMSPHDGFLRVNGVRNLFCCGEKAGPLVGHTEAIVTGTLAGYNGVLAALGKPLFAYPETLAVGDAFAFLMSEWESPELLSQKITFSGSVYFERMKEKRLYSTDVGEIVGRVRRAGVEGVFARV